MRVLFLDPDVHKDLMEDRDKRMKEIERQQRQIEQDAQVAWSEKLKKSKLELQEKAKKRKEALLAAAAAKPALSPRSRAKSCSARMPTTSGSRPIIGLYAQDYQNACSFFTGKFQL